MEDIKKQYLSLLNEVITKEIVIFGFDVVIYKAKNVGLILDSNNNVIDIKGDSKEITKKLIDEYVELAGEAAKNVVLPIFAKYPLINI